MALRILIADDSDAFLEAARSTLEREGIDVVGTASSATETIRMLEELRPEVVLVDFGLGTESGFELARRLAELHHHTPRILLISTHDGEDFAELIKRSPAIGFLSKSDFSARAIRELLSAEAA